MERMYWCLRIDKFFFLFSDLNTLIFFDKKYVPTDM